MAYRVYEAEFKEAQKGIVGITLNTDWNEPASDKPEDIEAAERAIQFYVRQMILFIIYKLKLKKNLNVVIGMLYF